MNPPLTPTDEAKALLDELHNKICEASQLGAHMGLEDWLLESILAYRDRLLNKLEADLSDLKRSHNALEKERNELARDLIKANDAQELHSDLLYQVSRCFPGESRHDTAKRYIRETEERVNAPSEPSSAKLPEGCPW